MPQQMIDLAPRLKKLGFQGNPRAFADLTGMPMGAVVSLGGLQRLLRVRRRPHHHEPPLRHRRAPVQRHAGAEHREGGLPRRHAGGRGLGRTGLPRARHRRGPGGDEGRGRRARRRARPTSSAARHREAGEGAHRRLREGGAPLPRRVLLRGAPVVRDRRGRAEGRPARLRAARRRSATSAARPTTGAGRATPATSPSTGPTWARTASPPPSTRRTSRSSPGTSSPSTRPAPARARSWSWPAIRAAPRATPPPGRCRTLIEWSYPRVVRRYKDMLAILAELSKGSKETEIRVATRVRGLANSMKNRQGVIEGAEEGQAPREEVGRRGRAPGLDRRRPVAEEEVRRRSSPRSTTSRRGGRRSGSGTPTLAGPLLQLHPARLGAHHPAARRGAAEARRRPRGRVPAAQLGAPARGAGAAPEDPRPRPPTGRCSATRSSRRRRCPPAQRIEAARRGRRALRPGLAEADAKAKVDAWLATLYAAPSQLADAEGAAGARRREARGGARREGPLPRPGRCARPARQADPRRREDPDRRACPGSARSTCRPCSTRPAASWRRTPTPRCASPSAP